MKKIIYMVIFTLVLSIIPITTVSAADWKYVSAGMNYQKQGEYEKAIEQFKKAVAISSKASTYRAMGESYEELGQYQNAANTYYLEAEIRKKNGETQAYLAIKQRADNLNSEVKMYVEVDKVNRNKSLAKYEPASGIYFGAFIDHDPKYVSMNSASGNKYNLFNDLVGKDHSTFFVYHTYGQPFPKAIAANVKEAGGALQIAMQPEAGLEAVKDDNYLRQFAADAQASGIPIFIRFASEMNGDWVKWSGNPQLYKQKFQLVAKVLRENASNIAMVWAPNSMPAATIHDYYPGDAAVDWIGMNIYSNPYNNGNISISTKEVNPLTFIDEVYNKYTNKPMMIAEYGASHYSVASNKPEDQTEFGIAKMRLFYEGLRLKYPRVKSVHWFSVDTLTSKYVGENRRLNNFSLTSNQKVLNAYKEIVKQPYFLSKVENGPLVSSATSGKGTIDLNNVTVRTNDKLKISTYVKTYDPFVSKVQYHLNGAFIGQSEAFPYNIEIPTSKLTKSNTLKATVYDSKGKVATVSTSTFKHAAAVTNLQDNQIRLYLNDKQAYLKGGSTELAVAPFTTAGRTLVPIRFISENLGATVDYNATNKQITVKKGTSTFILTVGSKTGKLNGKTITFEAAPIVQNGTTFVPLRVVVDALNAKINYDSKTQAIDITQ